MTGIGLAAEAASLPFIMSRPGTGISLIYGEGKNEPGMGVRSAVGYPFIGQF